MSKTVRYLITAFFLVLSTISHGLALKEGAPERYTVKKGDTLWGIAERFTDDAWQWPNIWYQNDQIDNPHLIFPEDTIGLVSINGEIKVAIVKRGIESRTVKITPTARIEPIESAIPTIPMDAIMPFIVNNRIVEPGELEGSPYILSAGGTAYGRGDFSAGIASAYGIFRASTVYKDPITEEILGLEAKEIGLANVISNEKDIVKLNLVKTSQQVTEGDRLLTTENRQVVARFQPKAPDDYVDGFIISVPGGVTQIGQYSMIVINKGQRDGITEGAILDIMKRGEIVRDRTKEEAVRLPSEKAGQLMVFRSYEKLSYALVVKATRALNVGDQVRSPY
ncbi:MAG: LysM peptidoglycan-binding domain-containing protein [Oleispira sp.]|nr:LysM peptidoglycan-binding domain-containing protein [Oleispira sp.]